MKQPQTRHSHATQYRQLFSSVVELRVKTVAPLGFSRMSGSSSCFSWTVAPPSVSVSISFGSSPNCGRVAVLDETVERFRWPLTNVIMIRRGTVRMCCFLFFSFFLEMCVSWRHERILVVWTGKADTMAVVHQHYRNPQTQVLRLTVGVALVPVGALVTLTVNKLNVSLERIISRRRPNWKNTSQKRENSKNAPSGFTCSAEV